MTPHPCYKSFAAALLEFANSGMAPAWSAVVYRYTSRKYATAKEMMSGDGAFKAGGRWNAPRTYHAVYCASSPDLANREYFASCRIAGIPEHTVMPLVGKAVRVDLNLVLDLCDSDILMRLGVTPAQLNADRWREETDLGRESLSQALGRAAQRAGFEALLVPSAQARSTAEFNVVLIIENAEPQSKKWSVMRGNRK